MWDLELKRVTGRRKKTVPSLIKEIDQEISELPEVLQRRVPEYIRQLRSHPRPGVRGDQMLKFAGMFTPEEAAAMLTCIEAGCERPPPVHDRDACQGTAQLCEVNGLLSRVIQA